ncbi:MAG: hypothetical protein KC519_03190, partial [Anaerolineae bacterium]|nr:hypothetical protein [Anaerolineae bacterium]
LYDESFTPTFIQVPNGTLWLAYQGLWKFSGDSWQRAHSDDAWNEAYYWLLGATDQTVWYLNGYGIERLDVASGEVDSFSLQSLGLKDDYIWAGALHGDRLWVVSDDTLYVYEDGDGWQTVANLPGTPDLSPVELVSDSEGAIYVTMYDYGTALRESYSGAVGGTMLTLLIPLLLIAADLFLRYLPEWLQNHRRWREMQRLVTVLPEFAGETPVSDPFTFGRFLLGFGVQFVWIVIVMSGITVTLIQVTGTAHLGLAFAIGAGLGYVGARWLIGGQLLVLGDPSTRTNIRLLMHGEYDHLLERNGYLADRSAVQATRHSNPMWQIYGLLLAGRHAEALPLLRDSIRTFNSGNFVNSALSAANLGYCLMYLDRIDEALPYFELTTHLVPEMATGYAALAHYYLKTKTEPARALEMAEVAIRFQPRQLISNAITDYGRLGSQMIHARALAFNGRCDEAERLAERALADRAMKQPVIAASIHVDRGQITLICGQPDTARAHLEQGLALDPNGSDGMLARELLNELAEVGASGPMA